MLGHQLNVVGKGLSERGLVRPGLAHLIVSDMPVVLNDEVDKVVKDVEGVAEPSDQTVVMRRIVEFANDGNQLVPILRNGDPILFKEVFVVKHHVCACSLRQGVKPPVVLTDEGRRVVEVAADDVRLSHVGVERLEVARLRPGLRVHPVDVGDIRGAARFGCDDQLAVKLGEGNVLDLHFDVGVFFFKCGDHFGHRLPGGSRIEGLRPEVDRHRLLCESDHGERHGQDDCQDRE